MGVAALIKTTIPFYSMVFGSSWLFIVIADDIADDIAAFNNTISNSKDSDRDDETKKTFGDFIQSYADAKQ